MPQIAQNRTVELQCSFPAAACYGGCLLRPPLVTQKHTVRELHTSRQGQNLINKPWGKTSQTAYQEQLVWRSGERACFRLKLLIHLHFRVRQRDLAGLLEGHEFESHYQHLLFLIFGCYNQCFPICHISFWLWT